MPIDRATAGGESRAWTDDLPRRPGGLTDLLYFETLTLAASLVEEAVEITDSAGCFLYVNAAFTRMYGYSVAEAIGRTPAELLRSHVHLPAFYTDLWEGLRAGHVWEGELISRHRDGHLVEQHARIVPLLDDTGELVRIVAVKRDVTQAKQFDLRYRTLLEAANDAILISDFETGRVVEVNRAAMEMFEYDAPEFSTRSADTLSPPEAARIVRSLADELITTGRAWHPELPLVTKNGLRFWGEVRLAVYAAADRKLTVMIVRDVSERIEREAALARSFRELKQAKTKLAHADRLAALGQLAASVAHEINNPASYVGLNLEYAREHLPELVGTDSGRQELARLLAECSEGMEQIRSVSGELRMFSRAEPESSGPVDINAAVETALRLVRNTIRYRARLHVELGRVDPVRGDRAQLTQVLTNVLSNAAQAITQGEVDDNLIEVTTCARDRGVAVRIRDTGCGVPASIRERLFEPFVTTKPPGEGTGLGLALSAEIIARSGGRIEVESAPGCGSTFVVWLPYATLPVAAAVTLAESSPPTRRHRILMVDDNPLVLAAWQRALQRDHDPVMVEGGRAALELLSADSNFDGIICDLMMPGIDGIALHAELTRRHPQLAERMIFCSGGTFSEHTTEFAERMKDRMLSKPVTLEDLHAKLAEVLG